MHCDPLHITASRNAHLPGMTNRNPEVPIGTRFGRLLTISRHIYGLGNGSARVWVHCDCGTEKLVIVVGLHRGTTASCGCLQRELQSVRARLLIRHGYTRTDSPRMSEYTTWQNMITRCEDPKDRGFADYGGRGIRVCERWRWSFAAFIEDMGLKPSPAHSIDRKDNNGDYSPENCRWATRREQVNNRRTTVFLTVCGVRLPLTEWAERTGLKPGTIANRLFRGYSEAEAVTLPLGRDPLWISPRRLRPIKEDGTPMRASPKGSR